MWLSEELCTLCTHAWPVTAAQIPAFSFRSHLRKDENKTHVLTTGILNEVVRTSAQASAKRMQHKTAKSFAIFTEPPHNASSLAELTPAIISMRRSDILLGINGGYN